MKIAVYSLALALSTLPIGAHCEVTYSNTKVPVAVVCPIPLMTAYLESSDSPPRTSAEWQSTAGHAHCRSVKNDRPLILVKSGSVTLRGKTYPMVELFPGGVIASTDGFGGPYFLLSTRIAKMPTQEQMRANAQAFLPTGANYSKEAPMGAMP